MRLLIDLDGVMIDGFRKEAIGPDWRHYPCQWIFSGCCTDKTADEVFTDEHFSDPDCIIPGAIVGVQILQQYFDVHFVSTPWHRNPGSAKAKYELMEHMGFPTKMLTLTHDKTLIPAFALVDDRPGLSGPWRHILYPASWNNSTLPDWENGMVSYILGVREIVR